MGGEAGADSTKTKDIIPSEDAASDGERIDEEALKGSDNGSSKKPAHSQPETADSAPTATNMASHAPIRMKLGSTNRKTSRKRKHRPNHAAAAAASGTASVGSSESSEEEDDEEKFAKKANQQRSANVDDQVMTEAKLAAKDSSSSSSSADETMSTEQSAQEESKKDNRTEYAADDLAEEKSPKKAAEEAHQQQASNLGHSNRNQASSDQPEGWRVKLYRLNMDGSWDDCGTGRIVCLYRSQQSNSSRNANNNPQDSETHTSTNPNDDNHNSNKPTHTSRPAPHQTTDQWLYQETGEATLCVQAELTKTNRNTRVLLRTRILLRDPYQRQGDNIITWCEPFYGQQQNGEASNNENEMFDNGNMQPGGGVDLALSFQDNAGCLDIWRQITQVQSRAAELLRSLPNDDSMQRMAAAIAAQHHAHLQQQPGNGNEAGENGSQADVVWGGGGHMQEDGSPGGGGSAGEYFESPVQLPDPPTLSNLEQIADTIAAIHNVQQREAMANSIAKDECAYLRSLLALFPAAEERNDYGKLATLAACVKTILLLNEPSILELVVAVAEMFEQVCSCLEYDPDLREKANHRWFLRERAKFRTVVAMDNMELVAAIHRSFRVNFLRDTLLRPTMDESSLSTLSSLQTFSHADVVKGVTMSPNGEEVSLTESYLVRVIRMLGIELHAICVLEWAELEHPTDGAPKSKTNHDDDLSGASDPSIVVGENPLGGTTWKQYLAPQDHSLASRRLRRRGCLNFLRELFNMVRLSLQQNDKDDFFSVISTLDVDLLDDISDNVSQTSQTVEVGSVASTAKSEQTANVDIPHPTSPVSLLSLMGNALADPNMDVSEKGAVLEIIAGVAMHDPSFIRRHCIEYHEAHKERRKETDAEIPSAIAGRPDPNEKKQIIYIPPPNDLLASLLFLLDVTTDAGVLLQATEIMRIILDTDIIGDNGSISSGFKDEAEGMPIGNTNGPHHAQPSQAGGATNDQKQFFSLFYEHYMERLVAPFQFTLMHPIRRVPENMMKNPLESKTMQSILSSWRSGTKEDDKFLRIVPFNAIRSSFAVELLSFCVRAHLYRMKFFLLKSRVLGNVLGLLRPSLRSRELSGDRCLKLAALRFLRSILSVHDEFYHRHIIQHDLFAPVFAALRENPVGDNLVSSSIVEMCDYIHNENIKSLLEYIVTKHISAEHPEGELPKLEDVSSPYVTTLTVLREAYEANRSNQQPQSPQSSGMSPGGSRYFPPSGSTSHQPVARILTGKALEDQRKFRNADEEESYFESDQNEPEMQEKRPEDLPKLPPSPSTNASLSMMAVDEVDAAAAVLPGEGSPELHRTPRMFSLAQAPLLNHLEDSNASPHSKSSPDQKDSGSVRQREASPPSIDALSPDEESGSTKVDAMDEDSSMKSSKSDEMEQDPK